MSQTSVIIGYFIFWNFSVIIYQKIKHCSLKVIFEKILIPKETRSVGSDLKSRQAKSTIIQKILFVILFFFITLVAKVFSLTV